MLRSRPALPYEPVPDELAQLLWSALSELGFSGGRVLDPACAGGQVLKAAGNALPSCEVRAVEPDPDAAAAAAGAFGEGKVVNAGFADVEVARGCFDAAVGFIPYAGAAAGADAAAALAAEQAAVAKTLAALRPGGVAALAVSRSFMDSRNDLARRQAADAAELVAAARLSDGAAGRAAAGVDVLVFRKLDEGRRAPEPTWTAARPIGAGLYENEMFASRDDLVCGRVAVEDGSGSGPRLIVRAGKRNAARAAAATIRRQIANSGAKIGDQEPTAPLYVAARDGGWWPLRVEGGRVVRCVQGRAEDLTPRSENATARLSALARLGELAARQLELERGGADDEACDEARGELSAAYEDFAAEWGHLAARANKKALSRVPEAPTIALLEERDADGKYSGRAAILSHRVIKPSEPRTPATPEEALSWSVNKFGEVRMDAMAKALGMPYDELWQALSGKAFLDVAGDGGWQTRSEFLSGNVRAKLSAAREAAGTLDAEVDAAAQRAWRGALGVPQAAAVDDAEISEALAAYMAAGRDLESRRRASSLDWGELSACGQTSLSDVASWEQALVRAQAEGPGSAWGRAFDGKLALEQKRAACAATQRPDGDLSRDEVLSSLASRRVEIVPAKTQDAWVAAGATQLAGKSLDRSMSWAVAVEQAVALAALAALPADARPRLSGAALCAELFSRDPALCELAHLVASGSSGFSCPELQEWYSAASDEAVRQMGEDELSGRARRSHHDRMADDMARSPAARAALARLVSMLPAYKQRRERFFASYREGDAPEAAAWRARRGHLAGNIEALEGAIPEPVAGADISMRLGAPWIPGDVVAQFAYETLGVSGGSQPSDIQASYSERGAKWSISAAGVRFSHDGMARWGTARVKPIEMIRSSLNCGRITVHDKRQGDGKPGAGGKRKAAKTVNVAETLAAQAKQAELEDAFEQWCHADAEREQALADIYNERFRSIAPRRYDGSELALPELAADIELAPWQRDAVARILESRTGTLIAHCVGAGKTLEFICGAMESKRRGLCAKPLIVVPNHLVEQTAAQFRRAYPSARILVSDKKSFEKENRAAFVRKAAQGDWDSVIIGQSQFDRLPLSPGALLSWAADRGEELDAAERSAIATEGPASAAAREISRQRAELEHRMDKLIRASRSATDAAGADATFDALGTDMLVVDEAHAYKNLPVQTKLSRVSGVATAGSARAEGMLMKTRWMRERFGGRSIVFATGTPVSNSMTELYSMQAYLDPATLESLGIRCFDEWAATFGRREASMEVTVDGGSFRQKERFSRFANLPELMSAVREFADVKTAQDIAIALPEADIHTVAVEPTEDQRFAVDELVRRADRLRAGGVDPAEDNMLKVTGDGRKAALDVRLLGYEQLGGDVEPGRKLSACADNVAAVWKQTAAQRGAQLIFCDTSTPHSGRWNVYDEMKRLLARRGIPAAQIAFIHDAKDSPERKEELFAKVRAGKIRVLIGSTEKMGTGTNVQERLAAIHDLDCPWRPADLEQRQGRILRQGNIFPTAQIFRYVCIGTFDSYLYQTVERKQRFISQALSSAPEAREAADLDDAATLTYAEMKAAATGDARIRERMELESKIARLELLKSAHEKRASALSRRAEAVLPEKIERLESAMPLARADAARVDLAEGSGGAWAGMTVGGEAFKTKKDACLALARAAAHVPRGSTSRIGTYRGLDLVANAPADGSPARAGLSGSLEHMMERRLYASAARNVAALDALAHAAACEPGDIEEKIAAARAEARSAREEAARPFAQAGELADARERADALDRAFAEEEAQASGFNQEAADALAEQMGPDEARPMRKAAALRAQRRTQEFASLSPRDKLDVLERDLAEIVAARESGRRCPPLACGGRAELSQGLKEALAAGDGNSPRARYIMHGMTDMLRDAAQGIAPAQHDRAARAALERSEAKEPSERAFKLYPEPEEADLGPDVAYAWAAADEDLSFEAGPAVLSDDEAAQAAFEEAAKQGEDEMHAVEGPTTEDAPAARDEEGPEELQCALLVEELAGFVEAQLSGRGGGSLTLGTMRATSAKIEELAPRCGFTGEASLAALAALRSQWREAMRAGKAPGQPCSRQSTGAR